MTGQLPSRSAQNLEYSAFCDSSSRTTNNRSPTALFAETTPKNARRRRHREEKSRIVETTKDRPQILGLREHTRYKLAIQHLYTNALHPILRRRRRGLCANGRLVHSTIRTSVNSQYAMDPEHKAASPDYRNGSVQGERDREDSATTDRNKIDKRGLRMLHQCNPYLL